MERRQRWKEDSKKVCMRFSRLKATDLEGLPHGNSQPEAIRV